MNSMSRTGAGAISQGHAVAGGHFQIGRFAVELAHAAGGHDRLLAQTIVLPCSAFQTGGTAADAVERQNIEGEGVFPDVNVGRSPPRGQPSRG